MSEFASPFLNQLSKSNPADFLLLELLAEHADERGKEGAVPDIAFETALRGLMMHFKK